MLRALIPTAVAAVLALAAATPASAAPSYVPGEVLVKYKGAAAAKAPGAVQSRTVKVERGATVREKVGELRKDPDVAYAVPNYIARASLVPNDPDFRRQWNLSSPYGINAPTAWDLARASGISGGRGVTVAVLDTGIAYERFRRFRRAPDLRQKAHGRDSGRGRYPGRGLDDRERAEGVAVRVQNRDSLIG